MGKKAFSVRAFSELFCNFAPESAPSGYLVATFSALRRKQSYIRRKQSYIREKQSHIREKQSHIREKQSHIIL